MNGLETCSQHNSAALATYENLATGFECSKLSSRNELVIWMPKASRAIERRLFILVTVHLTYTSMGFVNIRSERDY